MAVAVAGATSITIKAAERRIADMVLLFRRGTEQCGIADLSRISQMEPVCMVRNSRQTLDAGGRDGNMDGRTSLSVRGSRQMGNAGQDLTTYNCALSVDAKAGEELTVLAPTFRFPHENV